ncbi:hypothetical protein SALBM311S_00305 [Streptomyces alboniger]
MAAATAYDGVHQLGLPAGSTLLVTGAGGGVGAAVVQIARAVGLSVVGVASEGKKDFVEVLGAVHVPSGPGWASGRGRRRPAASTGSTTSWAARCWPRRPGCSPTRPG